MSETESLTGKASVEAFMGFRFAAIAAMSAACCGVCVIHAVGLLHHIRCWLKAHMSALGVKQIFCGANVR
jgi:hypothetical protein